MAEYFARVELHGARWPDDYQNLHTALARHGFTNCVPVIDGRVLRLPTGFYYAANRIDDASQVAAAVKSCADSTNFKSEIAVVKSSGSQLYLSMNC